MDAVSVSMWILAIIIGAFAYSRPGKLHIQGAKIAGENLAAMAPRIIMAILVSGFFSVIVPTELVATWLGKDSGMMGFHFAMVRLLSSVILPFIAGISALIVEDLFLGNGF